MTPPPFFAFYPADFAGDIKVEAMSTLQVGAYILLLCKAWQADPPASLPNDDAVLARLARLTPDVWSDVKAGVLSPFSLGTDDRWHQKRLRQEHETAKALIKTRAKAGRAGATTRWQTHGKRMAGPMPSDGQTDGIQSQNQKKEDPQPPPLPFGTPAFSAAWAEWKTYRREQGKALKPTTIRKQFKFLASLGEARAVETIDLAIRQGWAGLYLPKDSPSDGWVAPRSDRHAEQMRKEAERQLREAAERKQAPGDDDDDPFA